MQERMAERPGLYPPPNAVIVRIERFRSRCQDAPERLKCHEIRVWCIENCRDHVYVGWEFASDYFRPVVRCANPVDAVKVALRWV